ncbi:chromosome partition protein MukB [Endozoicomonas arenosclerae]|uniref:chromosome partition protein MukB n=1 Tax=Endozoicomonas arenosclerae TaxID=1633495 RepID=UPI000780AA91|nr:chromosome partition protein MukB [Endozoicomonas arenosclerae]
MSQTRTQINSLTLVNFRGIFFKTLSLHQWMSNLIGHNGAGKTTIMGALLVNRVPDNRLVRLRNNSDSGQDRSDNGIWGRIESGTCYSLVDYTLFNNARVIAGVQLKRLGKPRVELKMFAITGIDADVSVKDLVMSPAGENRYDALEGNALSNQVAMQGGTLKRFKSLGQFMDWQFECRIIPRRMENTRDRQRYYRMLETSLYGGLSSEMQKGLRDYLLTSEENVKKSVSSMQNALQETRKTRDSINDTREKRELIKELLDSSYLLGENVIGLAQRLQVQLQQSLIDCQNQSQRTASDITAQQQQISAVELEIEQLDHTREQLEHHEQVARSQKEQAETLDRLHSESRQLKMENDCIHERMEQQNSQQEILEAQKQEQSEQLDQIEEDVRSLVTQLANAEDAYSEEARKAGLYNQTISSLEQCRNLLKDESLDETNLSNILLDKEQNRKELSAEYHVKRPLLEQMENIRGHFSLCLPILEQLENSEVSADNAGTIADQWIQKRRTREQESRELPAIKVKLESCQKKRLEQQRLLEHIARLPTPYNQSITNYPQWLETLQEGQAEKVVLGEQLEQLSSSLQDLRLTKQALEQQKAQTHRDHSQWLEYDNLLKELIEQNHEIRLSQPNDLSTVRNELTLKQQQISRQDLNLENELNTLRIRLKGLEVTESAEQIQLQKLAELTGGQLVSQFFDEDEISLEEAAWLEAKMGPLRNAILVQDVDKAASLIRQETDRPDDVWLLQGEQRSSFSEDDFIQSPLHQDEDGSVLINLSQNISRISREPEFPTIGKLARENERLRLIDREEALLDDRQTLAVNRKKLTKQFSLLDQIAPISHWIGRSKPDVDTISDNIEQCQNELTSTQANLNQKGIELKSLSQVVAFLENQQSNAPVLDDTDLEMMLESIDRQHTQCLESTEWIKTHSDSISQLEKSRLYLDTPPAKDIDTFKASLDKLSANISELGNVIDLLQRAEQTLPNLRFKDSVHRQNETSSLRESLKQEWEEKDSRKRVQQKELELLKEQLQALNGNISADKGLIQHNEGQLLLKENEMNGIPLDWHESLSDQMSAQLEEVISQLRAIEPKHQTLFESVTRYRSELEGLKDQLQKLQTEVEAITPKSEIAKQHWETIQEQAGQSGLLSRLQSQYVLEESNEQLKENISTARARLEQALKPEPENTLLKQLSETSLSDLPGLFEGFLCAQQLLSERMDKTISNSDDPRQALEQLEEHLIRLEERLKDAESRFLAESEYMGQNIQRSINRQRKQIFQLNSALSSVHFGTIRSIKIEVQEIDSFRKVLDALQSQFYGDLFKQPEMTVEDALAEIFKRETGGTITGEKLLDYREYIKLNILIQRAGNSQFEAANPTNLSTGEAIGTGLAVLTMVLHSWESQNREGNGHAANRLLFLDEAARLDARALQTLEELCANQSLQLLVGAPDNVLPKNGVTYRMVRLMEPYEHVIFSGVRSKAVALEAS